MDSEKITFSFGRNWQDFVRNSLSDERVREAEQSLSAFLGAGALKGRTFLDVGCGSGLFSLAAYRLGAAKIVSFDLDPFSVACCQYLREREGSPRQWSVTSGSILDESFVKTLECADIVYAWGVLHHTGRMWQAIRNAVGLVRSGGVLFVALYNKADGVFGSRAWLNLKRIYNRVPRWCKTFMEYGFLSLVIMKMLLTLKNPVTEIGRYKKKRGMSFRTDIRDSLGGYPYEYASAGEIFTFCRTMGLQLEKMRTVSDLGLNEFLFSSPVQKT